MRRHSVFGRVAMFREIVVGRVLELDGLVRSIYYWKLINIEARKLLMLMSGVVRQFSLSTGHLNDSDGTLRSSKRIIKNMCLLEQYLKFVTKGNIERSVSV
jgi:hypothetical protein